jgi:Suppressor of fused protein (SUFU)
MQDEQSGLEFNARARLVVHYAEHFGDTEEEYNPASPVEGRPEFIVVEHRPSSSRPYWTYATAGLSLSEQRPEGPEPRIELLAYSPAEDQRVVDVLMVLARQVLLLEDGDVPYKTLDTVTLRGFGLVQDTFILAPPAESEELLDFPDLAKRMKDVRFTHAIGAAVTDPVKVSFIHVVPVVRDELEFAESHGTPALLTKMDLPRRGRDFGWGRAARDSVITR